jgi:hypothetical protein
MRRRNLFTLAAGASAVLWVRNEMLLLFAAVR